MVCRGVGLGCNHVAAAWQQNQLDLGSLAIEHQLPGVAAAGRAEAKQLVWCAIHDNKDIAIWRTRDLEAPPRRARRCPLGGNPLPR
jgi:hypothetical protein